MISLTVAVMFGTLLFLFYCLGRGLGYIDGYARCARETLEIILETINEAVEDDNDSSGVREQDVVNG